MIEDATLEELRGHADAIIEAVMARNGFTLRKAGARWVAQCPFHDDRQPSFSINDGLYHCFACREGGDHIRLIQELEGLEFPDAVRAAAEIVGVEVKEADGASQPRTDPDAGILAEAASRFHQALLDTPAAVSYLSDRGVTLDDITRFRIGYCPPRTTWWDGLDVDALYRVGVLYEPKEQGWRPYAPFSDRIVFPWMDHTGATRGFGARIWRDGQDGAKYVNSPNRRRFSKGDLLYGLAQARAGIRRAGRAVLVEGYLDVVAAHRVGLTNTVAVCGVAVTDAHLALLSRSGLGCSTIVMLTDGDKAGRDAFVAAAQLEHRLGIKVAPLPDGVDPDDLARSDPDRLTQLVDDARPAIDVVLDQVGDLDDFEVLAEAVETCRGVINGSTPPLARGKTIERVAKVLGVTPGSLTGSSAPTRTEASSPPPAARSAGVALLERSVLRALVCFHIDIAPWVDPVMFSDPATAEAVEAVWDQTPVAEAAAKVSAPAAALLAEVVNDPTPVSRAAAAKTAGLWLAAIAPPSASRRAQLKARQGDPDAIEDLYQAVMASGSKLSPNGGP